MAILDKKSLLSEVELERKNIELQINDQMSIEVEEGLNGIEVFKREKNIEQLLERFKGKIQFNNETVDDWVAYQLCMLAVIVKQPCLNIAEWGQVFYNRPNVFNACAKAVLTHITKVGELQGFLSTNYLEPELDKE